MTTAGIDVSKWQTTTPDLTGQSFLFARATYAVTKDLMYPTHIANARKAGLVTGAYHFGVDFETADAQAAAFLAQAQDADFVVLDWEADGTRATMSAAKAQRFLELVKAARGHCGLYHSQSGFPSAGQSWNWVARWGTTPPSIPWRFWQWQGSPLDRNYFNGSVDELRVLAGHPPPQGDDVNPTYDLPIAIADIGPTNVYEDRAGTKVLIAGWAGGYGLGIYTSCADGGSVTAMPYGPRQIRINLRDAANPDYRAPWVDSAAVTNVRIPDAPVVDCAALVEAAVLPLNEKIAAAKAALT